MQISIIILGLNVRHRERLPKKGPAIIIAIKAHSDPFEAASNALSQGKILILFPEGTRGKPEQMEKFKSGIAHLAKHNPQIPVIPIFLHGLGNVCTLKVMFCVLIYHYINKMDIYGYFHLL